ncbi:hypothetical protein HQ544_02630 [Candidatus Falkowbacteria bacterium]|nr:hypothetical protein [Candidatus Falkowbacteria bacterium]
MDSTSSPQVDLTSSPQVKRIFLVIIIFIIVVFGVRFIAGGSEDDWICEDGKWIKHGVPVAPMPTKPCPLTSDQKRVEKYIRENIGEISSIDAVLGGTWHVSDVGFLGGGIVGVIYEDGHIEARFLAEYEVFEGEVFLSNVQALE